MRSMIILALLLSTTAAPAQVLGPVHHDPIACGWFCGFFGVGAGGFSAGIGNAPMSGAGSAITPTTSSASRAPSAAGMRDIHDEEWWR